MENRKEYLNDVNMKAVTGGTEEKKTYQLYYKGEALEMDATVEALTTKIPKLKFTLTLLGLYNTVAKMTLNQLCAEYGQEFLQGLIDQYS